ncbi:hypothetical protein WN51_08036 [Melipona quadrifasciata]|uniref:Uncharacterized protein n=1 Tax=Melipona quadrifasciata TaxID=166423 RepID=A0A0M8ZPA2_9HYME|nr:hypothetical protein WN51_08036 [Melipona quadrifasciata]
MLQSTVEGLVCLKQSSRFSGDIGLPRPILEFPGFNPSGVLLHFQEVISCATREENSEFTENFEIVVRAFEIVKDGEERATCEVDGVTYYDGHAFVPKSDPRLYCICMPGYTGNNTEPFCKKSNRSNCDPLFRDTDKVHRNCVPVYYDDQDPQSDCSFAYRCQSADDEVISNKSTDKPRGSLSDEHQTCRFGNLTMQLGDELSEGTGDYESYCMKCVCEVPPFPTCKRIPFSDCDPMKYFKYPTNPIVATVNI